MPFRWCTVYCLSHEPLSSRTPSLPAPCTHALLASAVQTRASWQRSWDQLTHTPLQAPQRHHRSFPSYRLILFSVIIYTEWCTVTKAHHYFGCRTAPARRMVRRWHLRFQWWVGLPFGCLLLARPGCIVGLSGWLLPAKIGIVECLDLPIPPWSLPSLITVRLDA